jgi:hypothetical protein
VKTNRGGWVNFQPLEVGQIQVEYTWVEKTMSASGSGALRRSHTLVAAGRGGGEGSQGGLCSGRGEDHLVAKGFQLRDEAVYFTLAV